MLRSVFCQIFTAQLGRYGEKQQGVAASVHSSLNADVRVIHKISHKQPAKGVYAGLAILMKFHWVRFFHANSQHGFSLIGIN